MVAFPPFFLEVVFADPSGAVTIPVDGGGGNFSLVVQMLAANGLPTLFSPSNAVEVEFIDN